MKLSTHVYSAIAGILLMLVMGCAETWMVLDTAADIMKPIPLAPQCSEQNEGASYQGEVCLRHTDGKYRWVKQ